MHAPTTASAPTAQRPPPPPHTHTNTAPTPHPPNTHRHTNGVSVSQTPPLNVSRGQKSVSVWPVHHKTVGGQKNVIARRQHGMHEKNSTDLQHRHCASSLGTQRHGEACACLQTERTTTSTAEIHPDPLRHSGISIDAVSIPRSCSILHTTSIRVETVIPVQAFSVESDMTRVAYR